MPLVHEGISKQDLLETHGHVLGLRDINLEVAPRSIQVVMGLSGSGKSTLVRHINRLIDPTEGDVRIDGEDMLALDAAALKRLRRYKISMVFQRFALFPHRTVMENVGYGLALQGLAKGERIERAAQWVERVGLQGYEKAYPHHLSARDAAARRPRPRARDRRRHPADGRGLQRARSADPLGHAGAAARPAA